MGTAEGDNPQPSDEAFVFRVGREQIDIEKRWETVSILNDVLVGLQFLVGSVLFLWESTLTVGTWLFITGSVFLLIRPVIRLSRNIHVRRTTGSPRARSDAMAY